MGFELLLEAHQQLAKAVQPCMADLDMSTTLLLSRHFLGSPGIAVMDHQYDRVKEHPGKMIAAQVHWGRRDGQFHSGALELA
jgi:hypothetical protein